MQLHRGVSNTADINRYGTIFTVGALWSGLEQTWEFGLPTNIGHDFHRVVGWNKPWMLHLAPARGSLGSVMEMAESAAEYAQLRAVAQQNWLRRIDKLVLPHVDELRAKAKRGIDGTERLTYAGSAALVGRDFARRVFPSVFELVDKDGLVPLEKLQPRAPGVFQHEDLLFFAHPYLRRSLSRMNTLNGPFLREFQVADLPVTCKRRIALDSDLVGLASTYSDAMELAYWWGPHFDDNLNAIPVGITRHEASDEQRLGSGILRTEFWWYVQKNLRTFECEELCANETSGPGKERFGCRFVHSILGADGVPIHLDGAIRMYGNAEMKQRRKLDIVKAGRRTVYSKLWRIDGPTPVSKWKELIAHYYRDNTLVGEYFGGKETVEDGSAPTETTAPSESPILPVVLREEDGVHVASILHPIRDELPSADVVLCPWDHISRGDEDTKYFEADAVEIFKAIRRNGRTLFVPPGMIRFDWRDNQSNLPSLLHIGPHALSSCQETLLACRQLFEFWHGRAPSRAVTLTVGIRFATCNLWLSYGGVVGPMVAWLRDSASQPPTDLADMRKWSDQAFKSLRTLFPAASRTLTLDELATEVETTGVLRFKRRVVQGSELVPPDATGRLAVRMKNKEAAELEAANAVPHPVTKLLSTTCGKCGGEYSECACSVLLDSSVHETVVRHEVACFAWGCRAPAQGAGQG